MLSIHANISSTNFTNGKPVCAVTCKTLCCERNRSYNWLKQLYNCTVCLKDSDFGLNKGIGDAGSTTDLRMLWSAIVCLGLGLL